MELVLTWPKVVLIAWYIFGLAVAGYMIGKPRKPLDGGGVAAYIAFTVAICALVAVA